MVSSEASSPLDEMPTSALPMLAPLIGTSSTSLGWHWWPRRALQDTQHSWQVLQLLFIYLAPGEGKFQKDCRLENSCWRAGRGKLCYCYFHPVLGNHGFAELQTPPPKYLQSPSLGFPSPDHYSSLLQLAAALSQQCPGPSDCHAASMSNPSNTPSPNYLPH